MTELKSRSSGWLGRWNSIPLYLRIVLAMMLGLITGLLLGQRALVFEIPSQVILQLLGALAPPLILIAVTHVLMTTEDCWKDGSEIGRSVAAQYNGGDSDWTTGSESSATWILVGTQET